MVPLLTPRRDFSVLLATGACGCSPGTEAAHLSITEVLRATLSMCVSADWPGPQQNLGSCDHCLGLHSDQGSCDL